MRNFVLSLGFSAAALAAGTLCHRLAPGLGLVLMPMFWPLAALAALVPARWSVSAAAIRELNNLGENDQLVPGQIIKLPAEAQQ